MLEAGDGEREVKGAQRVQIKDLQGGIVLQLEVV